MGSDWRILTIQECASSDPYSTQIGPFGKALMADMYTKSGIPVLRGVNVNQGRFNDDDFVFIDEQTANNLSKFESFPNDVLLVHKGTLGKIGLMPKHRKYPRYIMGNSMLRVRCNPEILLPDYLYYWLTSPAGQQYLFSRVSQVGVPQIQTPLSTLRQAELMVPPVSEQLVITQILGVIDDKIDLLQETNATLEAIVQALFKSWFVDFDPVRAKAEGRDPEGVSPEVADLFPREFQDSELGAIPKGWRWSSLGDLSDVGIGKTPPRKEPKWFSQDPEHVRWVSIKDMGSCGTYISDSSEYLVPEAVNRFNVRVAPDNTVLLSFKMTLGRVTITDGSMCTNEAIAHCKLDQMSAVSPEFLYTALKAFNFGSLSSTSSIADAVNSKSVRAIPVIGPSDPLLRAFADQVRPLFAGLKVRQAEVRNLTDIRDTLLPRLMSGKLRILSAAT